MNLTLLCVGRPRDSGLDDRVSDYGRRIARFGVGWRAGHVREEKTGGRFSDEHVRQREGRALLEATPDRGSVVALDPGGRSWTSEDLARRLERWATPHATFLVGGPLGLHGDVTEASDAVWSLSRLTFPHELARLIVAEQLYRALTLLRGVPYHKPRGGDLA